MASCKAVFENIKLAACVTPTHAQTAALHYICYIFGDYLHMLYYLAFHISK